MITKVPKSKKHNKGSTFKRLANYILDGDLDKIYSNPKLGRISFTNCNADNLGNSIIEICNDQTKNTRAKNKNYHLIVSFKFPDNPNDEALADIEQTLVEALGLQEHKRISAVHKDTTHIHLHIGVNRIHPTTNIAAVLNHDYLALQQASNKLDKKYDLQSHKNINKKIDYEELQAIITHTIKNETPKWSELHLLLEAKDLKIIPKGRGLQIVGRRGKVICKPSELDRDFSRGNLEKILGEFELPEIQPGNKNQTAEAILHAGRMDSFHNWARKILAPAIKKSIEQPNSSWENIHETLSKFNCNITTAGRGLVITDKRNYKVKPSDLDRAFSRGNLEKIIGKWIPPAQKYPQGEIQYEKKPNLIVNSKKGETSEYWPAYSALKKTNTVKRNEALLKIRELTKQITKRTLTIYKGKTQKISSDTSQTLITRNNLLQLVNTAHKERVRKEKDTLRKQEKKINEQYHTPTWTGFILKQAIAGDMNALEALRTKPIDPYNYAYFFKGRATTDQMVVNGKRKKIQEVYDFYKDQNKKIWSSNAMDFKHKKEITARLKRRRSEILTQLNTADIATEAENGTSPAELVQKARMELALADKLYAVGGAVQVEEVLKSPNIKRKIQKNGDIIVNDKIMIRDNVVYVMNQKDLGKAQQFQKQYKTVPTQTQQPEIGTSL